MNERAAQTKPRTDLPELIERSEATAAMREAALTVAKGGAALVVVHGPPGSGRSAALAQAVAAARGCGLRVLTAACKPTDHDRRHGIAHDIATQARHSVANAAATRRTAAIATAIVVDDAQWADPRSVRLVHALLKRSTLHPSTTRPLLVVAAVCDPGTPDVSPLRGGAFHRHAHYEHYDIPLPPLSPDGVGRLLANAYGPRFSGPLVATAAAATSGNPAVLCATLHRCPYPTAPDDFAAVAGQVGSDRVRRALAALPAQTVALVQAAAVGRGDLSFDQLAEIAGVPKPQRPQARGDLARTGLFDATERPRPRDPLAADRLLALMDGARRRDLYARAARVAHRDGAAPTVLGHLLAHAHLNEPWVLPILYEAGAHARRLGEYACAIVLLGQAVDGGATGALRAQVQVELAMARLHNAPRAASRTLRRVSAEPSGPGGAAARLAAADLAALIGSRAAAELFDVPAAANPAADLADSADPAEAAAAAAAAWRLCIQGRPMPEARELATAVLAAPVETALLSPRLAAARVLTIAEEFDAAEAALEVTATESRRRGVPQALVWALIGSADVALRQGDADRVHARLAEATAQVPRRLWPPAPYLRLTAFQVLAELEAGRLDRAERFVSATEPDLDAYTHPHDHTRADPQPHARDLAWVESLFARGALALRAGRTAEARALLRECGRLTLDLGCQNPSIVPWRSNLAEALAASAPDESAALLAEDLIVAQEWGTPGIIGAVHLWNGLALHGQARIKKLRWAIRVLERSQARSYHARALVELSAALLESGEVASGRWTLSEATRALETSRGEATPRTREVIARYGALAGTARQQLTPAQLRVTLLAASGWTNAQIARELSITRRTVELHLTNSYRTLGVHGRADLAATLGQGGTEPEADPS